MDGLITCFRCRGEGIVYKYEGQLGSKNECPGCLGRGSLIANTCIQCAKCNGKGRVYEYDDDLGQRYECPLCKNKGYTVDRYIECPKCKGGGRIYPFQEEKLGVPKGCIPCGAIGYIKEKDYYNINFNENNYYYNKPIDPNYAKTYTIHNATQGQNNPLEQNMVWQTMPEEEYSVGGNSIYGNDNNQQNNGYNNNYTDSASGGFVNSGGIYNAQQPGYPQFSDNGSYPGYLYNG